MAAAEMVEPPPANRYAKMATAEELELWDQTFRMFDKDGGGDVDLRELGLMFRQLGQAPSEREMRLLIEEVEELGGEHRDLVDEEHVQESVGASRSE